MRKSYGGGKQQWKVYSAHSAQFPHFALLDPPDLIFPTRRILPRMTRNVAIAITHLTLHRYALSPRDW